MRPRLAMIGLLACALVPSAGCRRSVAPGSCRVEGWGIPAYDALYAPGPGGSPLIFETREAVLLAPANLPRLEAAAAADPAPLSPEARVVLQNDALGLWDRLRPTMASSELRERMSAAAAALVRRLALAPEALAELQTRGAPEAAALLPSAQGWTERGSELEVLSHERLFGLRRLFRIFETKGERALASQLVALDTRGKAWLTPIAGEVERLGNDGQAIVRARVWELVREGLGCPGRPPSLREVAEVRRVPGLGANRFLAEFDPPAPLASLPCARCHHDAQAMSLPVPEASPGSRHQKLLPQLEALWHLEGVPAQR